MEKTFLGRGWSFPPVFDPHDKSVVMVTDEANISQSLHAILSTMPGERITNLEFGCQLEHNLFDNMDSNFSTYIRDTIKTAILRYEPRIDVNHIDLSTDQEQGTLVVSVDYTVRATNARSNYVYPYYKLERSVI